MTTTMRAGAQTLTRIQNLARLYRSGYRSSTVDTTIDKLLTMEGARAQRELLDLEERLRVFERQYQLSSDEFYVFPTMYMSVGKIGSNPGGRSALWI